MSNLIAFTCTTIFHYLHFKRIAERFGEQAVFVISTPQHTNDRYERLVDYFETHAVRYCDADDIIAGRVSIHAIVAPYFVSLLSFIDPVIPRIRVLYGYAKDAWNYADWNKGFDLVLVYGPYAQRKLESMARTVSIGHPRFKGYSRYEDVMDVDGRRLSEWLAKSDRPTVLYCPTWGDLSSIHWFREATTLLLHHYKLVIKLHHGIVLSNDFNFESLKSDQHLFVCDETVDLFDLFPVSDIVISDYSGAIFDAVLMNKKIVLINSLSESVRDTGVLNIKKMRNIADVNQNNVNKDGSLDIQVRNVLPSAESPSELVELLSLSLGQPPAQYIELNAELYSHMDDNSPHRAHEEISKLAGTRISRQGNDAADSISFNRKQYNEFVRQHKEMSFVVWGAGDFGQLIVSHLLREGVRVTSVLDASPGKQGKLIHGIKIVAPEEYIYKPDERLILSFLYSERDKLHEYLHAHAMKDQSNWIMPF